MDVSALKSLYGSTPTVALNNATGSVKPQDKSNGFGAVFDSMLNTVKQTNALQIHAQNQEIKFALGEATNTHDLAIAQWKANIALQYTVAVRDRFISAYQEIMQMQI